MLKILLVLSAMLFACWACGVLLSTLFGRTDGEDSLLLPSYGYAYTHVAFYSFYMTLYSVELACFLVLALPVALAGAAALHRRIATGRFGWQACDTGKHTRARLAPPLAVCAVVVVLAAWPYLNAGWGNYWHSGNMDIDDGLRGREAYLQYDIFDKKPFDLGIKSGNQAWVEMKEVTQQKNPREHRPNLYKEWYAGDNFRFQYSSLAFWSSLLREPYGMDIAIIQMLAGMLMTSLSVFSLSQRAFGFGPWAAMAAAIASTCNAFYMGTFYAGHMGSLMFGAAVPALLQLALRPVMDVLLAPRRIFFCIVLILGIAFAYPHPLIVLGVPVILYHALGQRRLKDLLARLHTLHDGPRLRLVLTWLALAACAALALAALWHVTAGYRLRVEESYRSWGYVKHPIVLSLFIGLLPSPVVGAKFIGNLLSESAFNALLSVSCIAGAGIVLYFVRFARSSSFFLQIFGLCWIAWLMLFAAMIRDTYYIYKFLYTLQFLLVIGMVGGCAAAKSLWAKALAALLCLTNLASLVYTGMELSKRPENSQPERYGAVLALPRDMLNHSFLDMTGGDRIALRQKILLMGSFTAFDPRDAHFFIMPADGVPDITSAQNAELVTQAGAFAVKRVPPRNILYAVTWFDPEMYHGDRLLDQRSFRWIGQGRNGHIGLFIAKRTAPEQAPGRYLRICLQAGPSAPTDTQITVTSADGRLMRDVTLHGDTPWCVWLSAEEALGAKPPILVSSQARGRSILPYDDRILLFRVFEVNWTDSLVDDTVTSIFNAPTDITEGGSLPLRLLRGWEVLEHPGDERFRWVGRMGEIVLPPVDADRGLTVLLDVEPGPSLGSHPCVLEFVDAAGNVLHRTPPLGGRGKVAAKLPAHARETSIYTIRCAQSDNRPAGPSDTRVLNFRVFRITAQTL